MHLQWSLLLVTVPTVAQTWSLPTMYTHEHSDCTGAITSTTNYTGDCTDYTNLGRFSCNKTIPKKSKMFKLMFVSCTRPFSFVGESGETYSISFTCLQLQHIVNIKSYSATSDCSGNVATDNNVPLSTCFIVNNVATTWECLNISKTLPSATAPSPSTVVAAPSPSFATLVPTMFTYEQSDCAGMVTAVKKHPSRCTDYSVQNGSSCVLTIILFLRNLGLSLFLLLILLFLFWFLFTCR